MRQILCRRQRGGVEVNTVEIMRIRLWDARGVARFLKASRNSVYLQAEIGKIPSVRIGGLLRFDPEKIKAIARGDCSLSATLSSSDSGDIVASAIKRSGTWYAMWKNAFGKPQRKATTAKTKKECEGLAHELEVEAERGRLGLQPLPAKCTITLGELC